jgi:hypothetical protein
MKHHTQQVLNLAVGSCGDIDTKTLSSSRIVPVKRGLKIGNMPRAFATIDFTKW